ncbi:MAG: VOC family protein [Planctomycetota bacterium]
MSSDETKRPVVGTFGWTDLTVPDATKVRDFYTDVVGWSFEGLSMGDYEDYVMKAADGSAVAGVCHARGSNAGLPAAWLVYVYVANLDRSLERVRAHGGRVLHGPRDVGNGRMAVIEDPAGAAMALFEQT